MDLQIAEWITGDTTFIANTTANVQSDFVILQISLQSPQPFVELNQHAQDSHSYYALKNVRISYSELTELVPTTNFRVPESSTKWDSLVASEALR